jgi:hypothetical protein
MSSFDAIKNATQKLIAIILEARHQDAQESRASTFEATVLVVSLQFEICS